MRKCWGGWVPGFLPVGPPGPQLVPLPLEQRQDWGFPKGRNMELGKAVEWAQWRQSSPTLEGILFQIYSHPYSSPAQSMAIPTFCYSGQRHWNPPWILLLSFAPHICFISQSHQAGVHNTKHCEHSYHSTTPALVQATIIFHLNDWHSLSASLCTSIPTNLFSTQQPDGSF